VKILGLDIATRTGWCRYDGAQYVTGVLDCSPKSKDEPEGARFLRMRRGIHYLLADVDACVIERTYSKGKRTAEVLNGLTAVALAEMDERGIEYAFVDASVLKSFARREGCDLATEWSMKEEMRRVASATLARDLSDDEADAWWLVRYWQEHFAGAGIIEEG
jgi:hypothetical protein